MKSVAAVLALLAAAAGIAFYAGRSTARVPDPRPAAEEHERAAVPAALTLSPEMQRKFAVKLAPAELRDIGQTIQATGSVQANGSRTAHIRALAHGRIDDVYVRLGDRVRAGQQLLTYDNVELGEAIGEYLSAVVELRKAAAEAEVSQRALDRARNLVELGAIARAEFQRREAEHKNALATVESRKAEAAKIEQRLHRFGMMDTEIAKLDPRSGLEYHRERSHSTVTAPFAGIVTQLSAAPGETVDTSNELMTVSDLSTVWVQGDVYEKDINAVRQGRQAEVMVAAYPDRAFTGAITYVSDVLDPSTRTAKVRVEVPNPENLLKVEMFATVRIPGVRSRQAVSVPESAIQQINGDTVVFVRNPSGAFEKRAVRVGNRGGGHVEVAAGVQPGEMVVTEGSFLLKSEANKEALGRHEE